jgi:hypothetical protein
MSTSRRQKSITKIKTWQKFGRLVRSNGCNLLNRLDDFPDSVLITGCQRSGTTMLSRIITNSQGMVNYWFGPDDELDAALILSGVVAHDPKGRYCFQTTYLNECVGEYLEHKSRYKMVWVLRQPFSVVHSMVHNWKNFALNELFEACATDLLDEKERKRYAKYGVWGVNRLRRAGLSYCGKVSQLFKLHERLPADQLIIVDYDVLVRRKTVLLPELYRFIDLPYRPEYADMIHNKSIAKHSKLSKKAHMLIEKTCLHLYEEAGKLVTLF